MSERQFKKLLVEELTGWATDNMQAGFRYQFQSPDKDNSIELLAALTEETTTCVTVGAVEIPALEIGAIKLLPVLHGTEKPGYSQYYIARLRDLVAAQQGLLKGTVLLIIHNSMLDTITNSATDLAQQGNIWHPDNIKKTLNGLIIQDSPKARVSECLLEHVFDQIVTNGGTVFGFSDLHHEMLDGDLTFSELELLNDTGLLKSDDSEQIKGRIEENKKLYNEIEYITEHFSDELNERLEELGFGDGFIKKHFNDEELKLWREDLDFDACIVEKDKNRQVELVFVDEQSKAGQLTARNKAETKSGKRERHVILELDDNTSTFDLSFVFTGDKIDKKECYIPKSCKGVVVADINNKSKVKVVTLNGAFSGLPLFFTFELKRANPGETHRFRVLVIRKGDFYLEPFVHSFLIQPTKSQVTLQLEENELVISHATNRVVLDNVKQQLDNNEVGVVDFTTLANESDEVNFVVINGEASLLFNIEGVADPDKLALPLLFDIDRAAKLFGKEYVANFNESGEKVSIDNKEIKVAGRRLQLMQQEACVVNKHVLAGELDGARCVVLDDIEDSFPAIYQAYKALFAYYRRLNTLPSLVGWDEEYQELAGAIAQRYLAAISTIGEDHDMTAQDKQLVRIGMVSYEGEEFISPISPLQLGYYSYLVTEILSNDVESFHSLPNVTRERLNAQGLLPFIFHPTHDFSYVQLEKSNRFWLKVAPQQQTSCTYVRKLVDDKITEFKNVFCALFESSNSPTLIINSINNRSNHELFLGLVDYIKKNRGKVFNVHVNLYDDELTYCEFDRFAETSSYPELKQRYELDRGKYKDHADTLVELLRTKLTYSKFLNSDNDEQVYAHLTFFMNNHNVKRRDANVNKEVSGVASNGLLVGEAARYNETNGSYFTSFGLHNVDVEGVIHLELIQKYSSLLKPTLMKDEQHSVSKSTALAVSGGFKMLLKRSYDSSVWTTIVEPKVTLDFFGAEQDIVLIHYSDSYTNSANYDAITVTKRTEMYKRILEQDEGGIIEEFNAFNGVWLLRMITAGKTQVNERKEKRGIIGAYKYISCLLHNSDIVWVPMSVDEMLRVAGNIGLKMTESDFARYATTKVKKGAISDDVLFVGFKDNKMILLPVEVKTGKRQTHSKGVEQAQELKRYLQEDILGRQDFAGALYRGLFMRQVLMQVDKYKLYELYQTDYFEPLLKQREWWLSGQYTLGEIEDYPNGMLFVNVEDSNFNTAAFNMVYDILKIEMPAGFLSDLIREPLQSMIAQNTAVQLSHAAGPYVLRETTSIVDAAVLSAEQRAKLSNIDEALPPEVQTLPPTVVDDTNSLELTMAFDATVNTASTPRKKMSDAELSDIHATVRNCFQDHNIVVTTPTQDAAFIEGPASILLRVIPNPGIDPKKLFDKSQALKLALCLEQEQNVGFGIDKGAVTIDVPKNAEQRYFVDAAQMWQSWQHSPTELIVALGEDRYGELVDINFSSANSPHLLIGGTTGSGKSEALNTILYGMVKYYSPEQLKLMLIDPKGTELTGFEKYPHLKGQIGWDDEDALKLLSEAVEEMQSRYQQFKAAGVRSLPDYNAKAAADQQIPWWVVVLDEYADLTSDKDMKKEIEAELKRLAQKARAAGIHLIIATQKPSGEVINTGLRANLPAQLALRVKNATESRVILDETGAEVLNGKGDAYLKASGKLVRVQCARVNSE